MPCLNTSFDSDAPMAVDLKIKPLQVGASQRLERGELFCLFETRRTVCTLTHCRDRRTLNLLSKPWRVSSTLWVDDGHKSEFFTMIERPDKSCEHHRLRLVAM
jgi:hypothetical protein